MTRLLLMALALSGCGEFFHPVETALVDASRGGVDVFNGCADGQFVDRSAPGADRTVSFGGTGTMPVLGYTPRCIIIAPGQSVTFSGAFSTHPISPGLNSAARGAGSPNNPITDVATGSATMVRFPTAGTFPYFCQQHVISGMAGVVRVRP